MESYLTTYVLQTFAETLGLRSHHGNVTVVVLVIVVAGVIVPGTSVGLCVAVLGCSWFKSVEGPDNGYLYLIAASLVCSSPLCSS